MWPDPYNHSLHLGGGFCRRCTIQADPTVSSRANWDDATTTANFGQIVTTVHIVLPLLVAWMFTAKPVFRLIFWRIRVNPKSDFTAFCIIHSQCTRASRNLQTGVSGCGLSLKLSSRLSRPLGQWTEGVSVVNRLAGLFEQLTSTISPSKFLL